jgi:spermidine dehydrogenase
MIPEAMPGTTMEDVVTAKADYSKIDREGQNINIRLNSTVVHVSNNDEESKVDITYVRGGKTHKVRSKKCIMACYNSAIPYLCPEMPAKQKEGLAFNVKIPIVYTKVLINNWKAFDELKTSFIYFTGGFYKQAELAYPVSLGDYKCAETPDEPMVVHMCHVPLFTDKTGPEQWRAGREKILTTTFEEYESHVRDQLNQALGSVGFDAARDIEAITVNRWPHGYSYSNSLTWGQHFDEGNEPWVIGRQPFGNIYIANSDSAVSSSTKAAIKQAHRAVTEITG